MKLAVIISAVALVANADEYDAYDAHDDDHDVRPVSAVDCDVAALTPLISDPATIKCANESGYVMTALTAPTPEQSAKMCGNPACDSVLQKVEVIAPHECKLMSFHLHYDLLDPLDRACDDGKPAMGHNGAAPPVTGTVTGTGTTPVTATVTTIDPPASMNFTGPIPGNSAPPAAMTPASGANGATSTQQETTGSTGPEGTTPVVAPGPQSSETPSSVSSDTINTTSGSVSGHSGAGLATIFAGAVVTAFVTVFF